MPLSFLLDFLLDFLDFLDLFDNVASRSYFDTEYLSFLPLDLLLDLDPFESDYFKVLNKIFR